MIRALRNATFEDVIGVIALILLTLGGFWVAAGFQLPTGAEQLLLKP